MKKAVIIALVFVGILIVVGCAPKVMVPPKIGLSDYEIVGIIEFESNSEGDYGDYITRKFIETIIEDQPGVKIVELGSMDEILAEIGASSLGPTAIDSINRRFGIKTLITGNLDISQPSPNIHGMLDLASIGVEVDVTAMLTVRMRDTDSGATVWISSASEERELANIGFSGDLFYFDTKNPDKVHDKLTDKLVKKVSQDFRISYVRNRD